MRFSTKLVSAAGAIGLAASGALAAFGASPAAARVPAAVHLTAISTRVSSQASPAVTQAPSSTTVDTPGSEAPDTETESITDPAGGHADPPGANVDHQFDGVE